MCHKIQTKRESVCTNCLAVSQEIFGVRLFHKNTGGTENSSNEWEVDNCTENKIMKYHN